MDIWKEDTLKCSGNNLPKVHSMVSGKERLLFFDHENPEKVANELSDFKLLYWDTVIPKSHQHNKTY